ncbi:rod shape-determining protein MreC [Aquisalimonas sp.]|uniref:rod shape-determining protein MreC n=1 Tax=unclassified Aquisalimonas TaxID=2644645 RepID=UPI0025C63C7E|nr:rod shape-determining protein MreC [Aquisalimonas sp.]
MKPLFAQGPSATTRLILLVLLSAGLMSLDHRQHLTEPVRSAIQTTVHPVHYAVNVPFDLFGFAAERLASRSALIEENARLRDQQLLNDARLQRLDQLERENIRLQGLLGSAYEVEESVLIAELMRVDLDPYRHLLRVDKGTRSGARTGQAVIDANGIMGQVDSVSRSSAVVRLITDPSHAIPVEVNRNGLRSIAVGGGNLQALDLPHLPNNADVEEGDLLISSGLAGRFPRGYPVAEITEVERRPGEAFARVTARPLAQLDRSREMLLVRTRERQDPDEDLDDDEMEQLDEIQELEDLAREEAR